MFLLAGTGFGKSRVPKLFYLAHDQERYTPNVLSINPLDSLGEDQVSKKSVVQLKDVNLTGANCTKQVCDDVLQGKYNFVHVVGPLPIGAPASKESHVQADLTHVEESDYKPGQKLLLNNNQ
ncbi:uncharacterized protein MELLADRAFT_109980 [Melampsora larici-populina 98AG31]|uniref:Uncharacterized protein n=1 Tax=Melampsora larici-populina (strain 98AG31 / pathotype 3-4-7) TaxID=747676 RepID=F4RY92_MELLP|nr:uncharacterized protein MELLADRAFT_109980 [Melampsora larici-populina 98AG31]EGG02678.1 hypothetical protein MELLADRAFT_109980 [Melampsora larici-populina 98AG31]